MTVVERKE